MNKASFSDFFSRYSWVFALLVTAFIHYRWLSFHSFVYGDHHFFSIDLLKEAIIPYTWISDHTAGHVNILVWRYLYSSVESLFALFGVGYNFSDKILLLWPVIFLLPLSAYLLIKETLKNAVAATVGSLMFSLSTYFLAIDSQGHLTLSIACALSNFALLFFIKSFNDPSAKNWFFSSFALLMCSSYDLRFAYVSVGLFFLYLVFLFFVGEVQRGDLKKMFLGLAIPFVSLILMSIYWVLPQLASNELTQNPILDRAIIYRDYWTLIYPLFLMHPFWSGTAEWQQVQPVLWYLFVVPVSAVLGLLVPRKNKHVYFFSMVAVAGIFLAKQNAQPFVSFYDWMFTHFPGFNSFREATKFYYLISLGYAGLSGSFVAWCFGSRALHRVIRTAALLLILGPIMVPAFHVLRGDVESLYASAERPSGYSELERLLTNGTSSDKFRILLVPRETRWIYSSNKISKYNLNRAYEEMWNKIEYNKDREHPYIDILERDFSDFLLDSFSIKYIVVPSKTPEDPWNDFSIYFNKERQFYIDILDKLPYLHRINGNFGDIQVYQNDNYKPWIYAFSSLFVYDSFRDIGSKNMFLEQGLQSDPNFLIDDSSQNISRIPLSTITPLFGDISSSNIVGGGVLSDRIPGKDDSLYVNKNVKNLEYTLLMGLLMLKTEKNLDLYAGEKRVMGSILGGEKYIYRKYLKFGTYAAVDRDGSIQVLTPGKDIALGVVTDNFYLDSASKKNAIPNGSFENGLWQKNVGNCNRTDTDPIIGMSLDKMSPGRGSGHSLMLEAKTHVACTSVYIRGIDEGEYIFSFDYQSPNARGARYYIQYNDELKTVEADSIPITSLDWKNFVRKIVVPAGATSAKLYLYADSIDGQVNVVNRYDNVQFNRVIKKDSIIMQGGDQFLNIPMEAEQMSREIAYKNTYYQFNNLISNPSFENRLWQDKVRDCNKYDDRPVISMSVNALEKTDGNQSLQLEATRHIACSMTTVPIKGGATYLLSFDYQSPNAKIASYYVGFNDQRSSSRRAELPITDAYWNHFSVTIRAPVDATSLNLYVYARETNGVDNVVNRYDNFSLIEVPGIEQAFYVVGGSQARGRNLSQPRAIEFKTINPTKKEVSIKGAATNFFLGMNETYHDKWQLEFANKKSQGLILGWSPFAKPDRVPNEFHYKLNGFLNAWYVDVDDWCTHRALCKENSDGTYDMDLVIEFWPQRWLYLGLLISGSALIGCLSYLAYRSVRSRRRRVIVRATNFLAKKEL